MYVAFVLGIALLFFQNYKSNKKKNIDVGFECKRMKPVRYGWRFYFEVFSFINQSLSRINKNLVKTFQILLIMLWLEKIQKQSQVDSTPEDYFSESNHHLLVLLNLIIVIILDKILVLFQIFLNLTEYYGWYNMMNDLG